MGGRLIPVVFVLAVLAAIAGLSLFTVNETQLAICQRFGAIIGSDYAPGLHAKWPWEIVTKFDRRIQSQSYSGETFLTNDNRGVIADFYIKWRVKDAVQFYSAVGGLEDKAGSRLADIVKDGIKSVVAQRTLQQIVSAERAAVTSDMFQGASRSAAGLGLELIDVRVQRIDLPEDVAQRVYDSMKQGFERTAKRLTAEGESAGTTIKAAADRRQIEIIADADREGLRIRGEGDAAATAIYAKAFSKDPEFYAFYRSLQAYQRSLGKDGDLLVLTPDGEFFKYLKDPDKRRGAK